MAYEIAAAASPSADWFKAGVARQRVGPISLGIAPRACMILSKLLLLTADLSTDGERTRGQPPRALVVAQPIPPPRL